MMLDSEEEAGRGRVGWGSQLFSIRIARDYWGLLLLLELKGRLET
jgi:hypothetical protein